MKKILESKVGWMVFLLPGIFALLSILCRSKIIFLFGATISVLLYSMCAFEIHNINLEKNNQEEERKKWPTLQDNKRYVFNQYWLNGLGAFVGWLALYILLFYVIKIGYYPIPIALFFWIQHLGIKDLILVLVSFLGITGYLPYSVLLGNIGKNF